MQQTRMALKELQELDMRIGDARRTIRGFDARFEEVEEPALRLESDVNTTRGRLQEMKLLHASLVEPGGEEPLRVG